MDLETGAVSLGADVSKNDSWTVLAAKDGKIMATKSSLNAYATAVYSQFGFDGLALTM